MKSDKLRAQAHKWIREAEELLVRAERLEQQAEELAERSDRLRDAADTILAVLDLDEPSDEEESP